MNNKHLGLAVAGFAVILLILIVSLIPLLKDAGQDTCGCETGDVCEAAGKMPWQVYLGVGSALVLFVLSYIIVVKDKPKKKKIVIPENLNEEERKVIDELVKQDGMIFQSELVEKLEISKVKVTRLLDKLEGRGLIERRRRGMTNAVILKNSV
ncbi:MarR family transcriptional regulator [Candidatus Woesearchaeota archaeon]|jgi:uncharacterized membrane protein|nr:MarR family transcriptional regulator [Candidatus Woesearchaeota archaeon]MBT7062676.1 MarR family transcriptional regulator [Candidatus Woesearchaeota archaeon]MBT7402541.1 MarR family transcriptional regulator [Candidatus Woesearchaeota archaeon]